MIPRLSIRLLLAATLALAGAAGRVPAGRAAAMDVLVVRVLAEGTGQPIVNADVQDVGSGARRLTDEHGEARLPVSGASVRLRVRQLGFAPVERTVALWPEVLARPLVVTLSRVVLLSTTSTETSNACRGTADSLPNMLSLLALEQLRFGAGQYERFWDAYPFHTAVERRTAYFTADGRPLTVLVRKEEITRRDWSEPYRPGRVVSGRASAPSAVPLSLTALADPVFWENHCLVARRVVTVDGRRLLPLEFLPALGLRDPDWGGTAWLDSATSELRRVDFQLIGLERPMRLRRMEGYMTFTHPSPFIARPDSIVSLWWLKEPREPEGWGAPSLVELVRVASVRYLRGEPPAP